MAVRTKDTAALEALRRACERSLEQWPAARAALLYGSRARGDCRPGSDWDVILLTNGAGYDDMPDSLPLREYAAGRETEVNVCVYNAGRMRRRAALIGSFDRSVARDGVLLAGDWTRPELDKETRMDIDGWRRHMFRATVDAANAGDCYIRALRESILLNAFEEYVGFIADSAAAAERLAKAALMRRNITPRTVHDVAALADQLRTERPGDAETVALAEKLHRLNGDTKTLHVAIYHGDVDAGDGVRAVRRIGAVLDLLADELTTALAGGGDSRLSEPAEDLAKTALERGCRQANRSWAAPDRAKPAGDVSSGWRADVFKMDGMAGELRRHWEGFTERMRALRPATREPDDNDPLPS